MKKIIALVLIMTTIVTISVALAFHAGMKHALEDSSVWVESHNGIFEVFMDIDGNVYVHEAEGGDQ